LLGILLVSISPLLASLYISLSRLKLVRGGFEFRFIGLDNYRDLLSGDERAHFLGVTRPPKPLRWAGSAGGCTAPGGAGSRRPGWPCVSSAPRPPRACCGCWSGRCWPTGGGP